MKKALVLSVVLMSSIVLTACTDAEIASYAAKNNIPMTPQLVNSIKQATEPSKPNNPTTKSGQQNPTIPNTPNTPANPTNPMPTVDNGNVVDNLTNPTANIPQGTVMQGPKGDKGDQGPAGPQGEKGDSGDDGKDGRGIQSMKINDEGHLIAYYTDGTSEDCGLVKGEKGDKGDSGETPEKDFEKVGYVLPNNFQKEGHFSEINSCDYSLQNVCIKLCDINPNNPSRKYHYTFTGKIILTNYNASPGVGVSYFDFSLRVDDSETIYMGNFDANGECEYNSDLYYPRPLVEVTRLSIVEH